MFSDIGSDATTLTVDALNNITGLLDYTMSMKNGKYALKNFIFDTLNTSAYT